MIIPITSIPIIPGNPGFLTLKLTINAHAVKNITHAYIAYVISGVKICLNRYTDGKINAALVTGKP